MIAAPVRLLPEPDSPTTPRHSRLSMVRETSLIAWTSPSRV